MRNETVVHSRNGDYVLGPLQGLTLREQLAAWWNGREIVVTMRALSDEKVKNGQPPILTTRQYVAEAFASHRA